MDCIFCKIAQKQIPSEIIYENEKIIMFKDIEPVAPVHVVVIPKDHIPSAADITPQNSDIVAHIFDGISRIQKTLGLEEGFRVVTNYGENGGQSVQHLHFHLLGGRKLKWPPG